MDIQKWLKNAELQTSPEELGIPSFFHGNNVTTSPKHHRKRDRESTDSLLPQLTKAAKHLSPKQHRSKRRNPSSHESGTDTSSSSTSASSMSDEPSEHFERRPRHKTRKDLYEPRAGARKRRSKRKDHKRKERRADRTSERSKKKDKPGHKLVRTFKAANVSRDRLTLPSTTLGVFKKGRASSPVKGRGLPDLVFSEMRFLQNVREPVTSDKTGLSVHEPTRSKRDRKRVQEEEISSYFTRKRPPLKQKSHNVCSRLNPAIRETRDPLQCEEQRYESERPDSVKTTIELPPVELPYKPYLGFGGSGNRPHNHGSASYLTWSESADSPSSPPFLRGTTAIEIGQLARFQAGGVEPHTEICTKVPNLHQSVMGINSGGTAPKPQSGQIGDPQADAEQNVAAVETTPYRSNLAQCKYPHDSVNTSHNITTDHAVQTETSSPLKGLLLACDLALAAEPAALRDNRTQKNPNNIEPKQKIDRHGEISRRDVGEHVCAREAGGRHDAYGTVPRGGRSINSARSCPTHRLAYHNHEANEIRDSVQEDGLRLQQQHAFDRNRSIHSAPRNFSSIDRRPVLRGSGQVNSWFDTPTTYFSDQDLRSRAASASRSFSGGTNTAYSTHMFDDYGELQPCTDQQPYPHYAETEEQMDDAFEEEEESHIAPAGFWRANKLY